MTAPTMVPLGRPPGVSLRTHCFQGHELTPENTANDRRSRYCRTCRRRWNREYQRAHKGRWRSYRRDWMRTHRLLDIYLPRILAPFGREVSEMSPVFDRFLRDRGQVEELIRRAG